MKKTETRNTIFITVDDREKLPHAAEMVEYLVESVPNAVISRGRCRVGNVEIGDVTVETEEDTVLVVEIKHDTGDLIRSVKDGRFISQIKRLARCKSPHLFYIGNPSEIYLHTVYSDIHTRKWTYNLLMQQISLATVSFGVVVSEFRTNRQMMKRLSSMIEVARDPKIRLYNPKPKHTPGTSSLSESILCTIPGIGIKTAKALLSEFWTLKNIFESDTKKLERIPGIGTKTAKLIFTTATEVYSSPSLSG